MTEKYFFIDYENVHQSGLNGIEKLTENDKVIIFYTPTNETITFAMYKKMTRCNANIDLHRITIGGKDALDFQLCTFLGYVIGNSPETKCYIISDDKSYEYIVSFWKARNTEITISPNISKIIQQQVNVPAPESDFDKAVKPLNLSETAKQKLLAIYNSAMLFDDTNKIRQYINNEIGTVFGSQNQKEYYAAIKPLIKDETVIQTSSNINGNIPEKTAINEIEQIFNSLNLSTKERTFLYDLIYDAYKEHPTNKECRQNYIWIKMIGYNKNDIFNAIKPYI